jgi:hypothetical protein
MAEKTFDIGFGTSIDASNLQKGLSDALTKAEKEVIRSAQKQTEAIYNAAKEQIDVIKKTEIEKIAEVKKGIQEQIAAVKAMPGLDKSVMQEQIRAIKDNEQIKIDVIKSGAKLQEAAIKDMANKQVKTVNDLAKKQVKAFQDAGKKSLQSIKEFAKGAAQELLGMDQVLSAIAGGPTAIGKFVVDIGKQVVSTLNDWNVKALDTIKVQETLKAVIKSSGAEAWTTASQLNQLAREQSNITGKTRDEITQMQSVLLGFRNVTKDVFGDATQAAIAMSAVMGGDLRGAANALGKALDVPSQGLTALTRQGFRFTEQQKAMVVELEKAGKLQEAQRIILGEVEAAFSGAANSTNSAIKAQVAFNNAVTDFQTNIGKKMSGFFEVWNKGWSTFFSGLNTAMEANEGYKEDLVIFSRLTTENAERVKVLQNEINILNGINVNGVAMRRAELQKELDDIIRLGKEETDRLNSVAEEYKEVYKYYEFLLKAKKEGTTHLLLWDTANLGNLYKLNKMQKETGLTLDELIIKYEKSINSMSEELEMSRKIRIEQKESNNDEIQNLMNAEKFREENLKALDEELKRSIRNAEVRSEITEAEANRLRAIINARKEGETIGRLETSNLALQNQFLDANVQAYENLLSAAKEFIDGTAPEEQARFARLKASWAAYGQQAELEKRTEEERKKRLADLTKQGEEAQKKLNEILKDAQGDARILEEERIQRYISDVKLKNAKKGIEAQYAHELRLLLDLQKEKLDLINENHTIALNAQMELEAQAIKDAKGNEVLITQIKEQGEKDRADITGNYNNSISQVMANSAEKEKEIERQKIEAIKQMHLELYKEIVSMAQEHINALGSIANSITAIWSNNVDREMNAKIRANKKMVQSDEERAAAEKKIMIEATNEKHKIDLFTWATNVTMAAANAAMAVINALTTQPFMPMGPIMAGIAAAMGAMQVAAVISARPKPPTFHTGGIVPGARGSEVHTVQKAGEVDLTPGQFKNTMRAISNLATGNSGGGTNLVVNVENNAANMVSTSQSIDTDGLRIVIEQIQGDALSNGRMDDSLARQMANANGKAVI